ALEFCGETAPKHISDLLSPGDMANFQATLDSEALDQARRSVTDGSLKTIEPLLETVANQLPHLAFRVNVVTAEPASDDEISDAFAEPSEISQIITDAVINETSVISVLMKTALKLNDQVFFKEVKTVHNGLQLVVANAGVAKWYQEHRSQEERRPSKESSIMPLLTALHNQISDAQTLFDGTLKLDKNVYTNATSEDAQNHVIPDLDRACLGTDFTGALADAKLTIRRVSMTWTTTLLMMDSKITESCPAGFELHGDDLMSQSQVLETMHSNPHYAKIGPMCEMIKDAREACMVPAFRPGGT
ncbi:unnamed protein product, partial [Prorocentrum cordatum]